jgi:ABC-type Fe3+/spermidine/putrescine transport system ATPase subunit
MLEIHRIFKEYEGKPLLRGVTFRVQKNETVCLLGPSGGGKSTLLRIIAGLEQPSSGEILWNGKDIGSTPVHRRNFGLMFQDYALFPHKNVFENVAFGLRMQDHPREKIQREVERALEQVEMSSFARRKVTDLSGGEAFSIADRLLIMHDGRIVQQGRPEKILRGPANAWVARFLGLSNLIEGEYISDNTIKTIAGIFHPEESLKIPKRTGMKIMLLVMPTAAKVVSEGKKQNCIRGKVSDAYFQGESFRVQVDMNGSIRFSFLLPQPHRKGQKIILAIDPKQIKLVKTDSN